MSKAQYNLTKQTNYLKRTMFLDPAGPVTVQRFEEVKYPKIAKFEELARGFTTVKHQREAGVPYFDAIATAVGATSTTALAHSTEEEQF
jgi:hypothetical protein